MKKMTTIRINKKILEQAKELGLNISKICENALKLYITRLQGINNEIINNNDCGAVRGRRLVWSRIPAWGALDPSLTEKDINWDAFREWLEENFSAGYARDVFNYSRKYVHCLLNRDLSELLMIRKTKRQNIVKALSNLAKFLGIHDQFLQLMHQYDLEWGGKSNDDLVIERYTRIQNPNEVFEWIKQVKRVRCELADFMDFMAVTGLRLVEAIKSYNLIIELSRKGRLNEYYNEEKQTLEHFRFKEIFIRKSKKAFVSFIPKEFIERIIMNNPLPDSAHAIVTRVRKQGLKARFSDVREAHGTFMTKYLKESEINFIHGRVTTSIFMANYFNAALIADLKQRIFKGIKEIQALIS